MVVTILSKNMDRRAFLAVLGVVGADFLLPRRAYSQPPTTVSQQDIEAERLTYLQQIRAATVDRVLSPVEQERILAALASFPVMHDRVASAIAQHNGNIGNVVQEFYDTGDMLSELFSSENAGQITNLLQRAPALIQRSLEGLLRISPLVYLAPASKDYEELVAAYRVDLNGLVDTLTETILGIDLKKMQAHVNNYKGGMAIYYLPFLNPLEGFQALFHRVFDLYLQLAHQRKARVVWSTGNESPRETLERLFLDPEIERLAIVGHGTWNTVNTGGISGEPDDLVARTIISYGLDRDGFMQHIKDAAANLQEFNRQRSNRLTRSRGERQGLTDGPLSEISWLAGAMSSFQTLFTDIVHINLGGSDFYTEFDLEKLAKDKNISRDAPVRQKSVFRYTCGGARYGSPNFHKYDREGITPEILSTLDIDEGRFGLGHHLLYTKYGDPSFMLGTFFSARRYADVGQYEQPLARAYVEAAQKRAAAPLEQKIAACEADVSTCLVMRRLHPIYDGRDAVIAAIQGNMRTVRAEMATERREYRARVEDEWLTDNAVEYQASARGWYDLSMKHLRSRLRDLEIELEACRTDPFSIISRPDWDIVYNEKGQLRIVDSETKRVYGFAHHWCSPLVTVPDRDQFLRRKQRELAKITAQPLANYAPQIIELPCFGTAFAREARGYEGTVYLPEFIRDPLITRMGGLEKFKL